MFEYTTPLARELSEFCRRQYLNGRDYVQLSTDDVIAVHRDATVFDVDGNEINAIRAYLIAVDVDALTTVDNIDGYLIDGAVSTVDAIQYAYDSVMFQTATETATETATPRRVIDTTAVIIKRADGTMETRHVSPDEVEAVITAGHRVLLANISDGVADDYADDIDAEIVTETSKH